MIERYFNSQMCIALPLTDIGSRYFWKTVPTAYHNFDSITAINNDEDDPLPNEFDPKTNSENEDEEDGNEEEEQASDDDPLTLREFNQQTHWYTFKATEYPSRLCAICRSDFENDEKITVLDCHHQYHENCIREWITSHNALCPTCRRSSRQNSILADTPVDQMVVVHTPPADRDDDEMV